MAGVELARKGWHLTDTGIKECTEDGNNRIDVVIKNALNTDLREIGAKWVPEGLVRGKVDYIQGPVVLQISKIRNVTAPKDNEESQGAPRMFKLVLTDGHTSCTAIETEPLKSIGFNTAPGSKILIDGTVGVESNILQLNNKNTRYLGGRVDKLAENWELKKSLKHQNRSNIRSEGGPPPYVPFGQKLTSQLPNPRKDNFKSLDVTKDKSGDGHAEFQQQRQATIAEALQAKDTKAKTFGGGGKIVLEDHDVAKIIDMGFSMEDATNALRFANGNVNEAIHNLLSKGSNSRGRPKGDRPERSNEGTDRNDKTNDRSVRSDRFDKKDKISSRQTRRGGNQSEESSANSQPSGPSTLFDFLTNKIPVKEETKTSTSALNNTKPRSQDYTNNKGNNMSSTHTNTSSGSSYNNSNKSSSSTRTKSSYDNNTTKNNYHDKSQTSSNDNYNRRQNNVPPRFAQKYGKDSSESSQYSGQSNSYNNNDHYDRTRQKRDDNNYRNDYNTSSRDSSYRGGNKYSQDHRRSDYYDSSSQRSSGASSRSSGDIKKYSSESSTSKSSDNKYSKNGGSKSQTETRSSSSTSQKSNSKWETRKVASWNRGDMCLAKYWEDKQFYPAVVENIDPDGVKCIITFPEYGNTEEVLCTDMMPMPAQNWSELPQQMNPVQFTAPPPYYPSVPVCPPYQPDQYVVPGQFTAMEFRRGGNGPQYTRNKTDKNRPTQQYYNPPGNKSYQ